MEEEAEGWTLNRGKRGRNGLQTRRNTRPSVRLRDDVTMLRPRLQKNRRRRVRQLSFFIFKFALGPLASTAESLAADFVRGLVVLGNNTSPFFCTLPSLPPSPPFSCFLVAPSFRPCRNPCILIFLVPPVASFPFFFFTTKLLDVCSLPTLSSNSPSLHLSLHSIHIHYTYPVFFPLRLSLDAS